MHKFLTDHIEYNHPSFLMIPFMQKDIHLNSKIANGSDVDLKSMLRERYPKRYVTITKNGRQALSLILNHIREKEEDSEVVNISTTSENLYISGCVTGQVEEEKMKWNRGNLGSKIQLFNHEFGFADKKAFNESSQIFIEDCASSFNSKYEGVRCGSKGDYALFSFSKFFPIQIGGFLLSNEEIKNPDISADEERYIETIVGHYLKEADEWSLKRREFYTYYASQFSEENAHPYFELREGDVPGAFLFKTPENIDLTALKKYYWERGVTSTIFYGENAFILPLHHQMEYWMIDYFFELYKNFKSSMNE